MAQLTFRVAQRTYDTLLLISKKQRRKQNEVARALLDRGIAAFLRDGILFEDDPVEDFVDGLMEDARALARQDEVKGAARKRREAETPADEFDALRSEAGKGSKKSGSKRRRKNGSDKE